MGFLGHLIPSLNKDLLLREELNAPKSPFKLFQGGPPKKAFFDPKIVIFPIFQFFRVAKTLFLENPGFV